MPLPGTVEFVRAALVGDEVARSRLLERVRPRLVLWAATRMSGELRASYEPEDVAQEVLLAVHRDFERLAPRVDAEFLAWMFGIAEHRVRDLVDHLRAAKRRGTPPMPTQQPSPSSLAADQEEAIRLVRAIEKLPDDYREVVRLRRFEDRPASEVARIMCRSEGAIRVLYFRAVAALREQLSGEGE
jgi:RNA polymerase sigma-70 factor (ECF subfamily)